MKSLTNWVLTFLLGSGISSLTMAGEGYDLERGHGDRGAGHLD